MKIRYLGHSCFEFTMGNEVKVVTDPYTKVGYELVAGLTADVVTVSHSHFDHNYTQAVDCKLVLTDAGAQSIQGIEFLGVNSYHDSKRGALRGKNVIFKMKLDGITVCHMGDIGEECTNEMVEKIGKIDVLLIPVGGTYTVDALGAKKYADALQPKVIIPMHYKPEDGALDIDGIETFLKQYPAQQIKCIENGVAKLDKQTSGIIYMKRVKNV